MHADYRELGLETVPLMGKRPVLRGWRTGRSSCVKWPEHDGIGIVCGAISGNLLVIDVEAELVGDQVALRRVRREAVERGVDGLLAGAWGSGTTTPSGGRHLWLRTGVPVPGNRKLAAAGGRLLVETRGEGGLVAAPPGEGREWIGGQPEITETTGPQLAALITCFALLGGRVAPRSSPATQAVPGWAKGMDPEWVAIFGGNLSRARAALDRLEAGMGVVDSALMEHIKKTPGFDTGGFQHNGSETS